jgi:hypothetical protein
VRFLDNAEPRTKLEPPKPPPTASRLRRLKRQTKKPGDLSSGDLFLNSPTVEGRTVLSAIDDFDRKKTAGQKREANLAIMNGYHLSECSDSYGTFSSTLVKQNDVERKQAKVDTRPENQRYHNLYNGQERLHLNIIVLMTHIIITPVLHVFVTLTWIQV